MTNDILTSVITIATAIIGLAIIALLVSSRADTANVVGTAGAAFNKIVAQAVSPVSSGGNITLQ